MQPLCVSGLPNRKRVLQVSSYHDLLHQKISFYEYMRTVFFGKYFWMLVQKSRLLELNVGAEKSNNFIASPSAWCMRIYNSRGLFKHFMQRKFLSRVLKTVLFVSLFKCHWHLLLIAV